MPQVRVMPTAVAQQHPSVPSLASRASRAMRRREQLWRMYHSALAWVLEEAKSGDLFDDADSDAVAECLGEFKSFYTSRCPLSVE